MSRKCSCWFYTASFPYHSEPDPGEQITVQPLHPIIHFKLQRLDAFHDCVFPFCAKHRCSPLTGYVPQKTNCHELMKLLNYRTYFILCSMFAEMLYFVNLYVDWHQMLAFTTCENMVVWKYFQWNSFVHCHSSDWFWVTVGTCLVTFSVDWFMQWTLKWTNFPNFPAASWHHFWEFGRFSKRPWGGNLHFHVPMRSCGSNLCLVSYHKSVNRF